MSDAERPYITRAEIESYGCVRDVTLELTRLHALIGPNDSGKSTVLSALRSACTAMQFRAPADFGARADSATKVSLFSGNQEPVIKVTVRQSFPQIDGPRDIDSQSFTHPNAVTAVDGARMVRWNPDIMREPCGLIPEDQPLAIGEKGEHLASIYDAILSRDRDTFGKIEDGVRKNFPTVKSIWLPTSRDQKKTLGIILNDGKRVPAAGMSEGLLYWLAFAALPYVKASGVLLVEEPENGLHPSRIAEIVKALREMSNSMQVILATHSPLVINEMQPEEVTILTRDDKTGTKATRMDRTTHFKQREKVYALGELWLSFADGNHEADLVPDTIKSAS